MKTLSSIRENMQENCSLLGVVEEQTDDKEFDLLNDTRISNPRENLLFKHILQRNWDEALPRALCYPGEAKWWVDHSHKQAETSSLEPEGKNRSFLLPIHQACILAGSRYNKILSDKGKKELEESSNNSLVEVIYALLDAYPEGAFMGESSYGRLPLHLACLHGASLDVIRLLVENAVTNDESIRSKWDKIKTSRNDQTIPKQKHPENRPLLRPQISSSGPSPIQTQDLMGRVPLHYALYARLPFEVTDFLISAYPLGATIQDFRGWLPIHVAARRGVSEEAMNIILQAYPSSVDVKTYVSGLTPLSVMDRFHGGGSLSLSYGKRSSHRRRKEGYRRTRRGPPSKPVVIPEKDIFELSKTIPVGKSAKSRGETSAIALAGSSLRNTRTVLLEDRMTGETAALLHHSHFPQAKPVPSSKTSEKRPPSTVYLNIVQPPDTHLKNDIFRPSQGSSNSNSSTKPRVEGKKSSWRSYDLSSSHGILHSSSTESTISTSSCNELSDVVEHETKNQERKSDSLQKRRRRRRSSMPPTYSKEMIASSKSAVLSNATAIEVEHTPIAKVVKDISLARSQEGETVENRTTRRRSSWASSTPTLDRLDDKTAPAVAESENSGTREKQSDVLVPGETLVQEKAIIKSLETRRRSSWASPRISRTADIESDEKSCSSVGSHPKCGVEIQPDVICEDSVASDKGDLLLEPFVKRSTLQTSSSMEDLEGEKYVKDIQVENASRAAEQHDCTPPASGAQPQPQQEVSSFDDSDPEQSSEEKGGKLPNRRKCETVVSLQKTCFYTEGDETSKDSIEPTESHPEVEEEKEQDDIVNIMSKPRHLYPSYICDREGEDASVSFSATPSRSFTMASFSSTSSKVKKWTSNLLRKYSRKSKMEDVDENKPQLEDFPFTIEITRGSKNKQQQECSPEKSASAGKETPNESKPKKSWGRTVVKVRRGG